MSVQRARRPPVDWWRVITDLGKHKLTTRVIAKHLGKPRSGISMLRNGLIGQPKHAEGEELIDLWIQATGHKREELPRRASGLSVSQAKR